MNCAILKASIYSIANFTGIREEVDEKINLNDPKQIAFGPEL